MTDAKEQILDILRKAYQIEVDGYTFYSIWEQQHFVALNSLYQSLRSDFWGQGSFAPF